MDLRFGLIGEKLPHSFSKEIHESLWAESYELIELKKEEVEDFFNKKEFSGVNVTIPYKETAMNCCDVVDENAKKIGCVNTVINKNGVLYGYNTDYNGFKDCVARENISFENKSVLILGSGATSKTVYVAVNDMGAGSVSFASRKGKINYENVYEKCSPQVIVNTTPVGMYPETDGQFIDLSRFSNLEAYADVVYNPLKTKTYLQAKDLGLKCCCGLAMLVGQAVSAAEYFTDSQIAKEKAGEILEKITKSRTNIVLTGMPGCGKSTVGRIIAKKLSRKVFDSDELIEQKAGLSIPEMFEKYGEAYFRSLETQVIAELSKKNGIIISTGGGVPLKEENRQRLSQNGRIYFIKRDLNNLARGGRPLSKDINALEQMYKVRKPVYSAFADITVENNNTSEQCAQQIWSDFI